MNLTELQLLQQKIAGMTGSEFEKWLMDYSDAKCEEAYDQGSNDGYGQACEEHCIE